MRPVMAAVLVAAALLSPGARAQAVATPAPDVATMSLEDLWRDACLWEVGSNTEKVPAARRELIRRGEAALDFIVPSRLDTKDTLITRALGVVMTGIGAPATARLRAALRDEKPNIRRNAADLLGQLGDADSAPAIAELLAAPETRGGALVALGALKSAAAVPAIARLLASPSSPPGTGAPGSGTAPPPGTALERDRVQAAATLGGIGGADAERALALALRDDAAQVRFAAQLALERLKASTSLVPIVALRTHGHARLHAIAALGAIADPADAPALLPHLWDEAPVVRGFAAEALGRMGREEDRETLRAALDREADAFARGKIAAALAP